MLNRALTVTAVLALVVTAQAQASLSTLIGNSPQVRLNKDAIEDLASHLLAGRLQDKTPLKLVKIRYCGAQSSAGVFLAILSSSAESVAEPKFF